MNNKKTGTLSEQVHDGIIDLLKSGEGKTNKLPSEAELVRRFGASSTTVREALTMLRLEGLITKKHGSGNYFHRSVLEAKDRIDQYFGFNKYLEARGYKVGQILSSVEKKPAPERAAKALGLEPGDETVAFSCSYTADGLPVIYSDYYLNTEDLSEEIPATLKTPLTIYDLMVGYFENPYAYTRVEYLPYLSDEADRDHLSVEVGVPLVAMTNTYYSSYDKPMVYGFHKFNHDYVNLVTITIH